jgi:ribosomal protein S18 acetylase RimI-like enzyme
MADSVDPQPQLPVEIRLAEDADHSAILRLFRDGILEGQLRSNDTGADIEFLREGYFSDDGASAFWVACNDDLVVGMIGVQMTKENQAEIRRLRVDPNHRRQGIGTALLTHAIEFCRERGYLKVILDVRIERAPAIAMFEKMGFTLARTRQMSDQRVHEFYLDLYREPQS